MFQYTSTPQDEVTKLHLDLMADAAPLGVGKGWEGVKSSSTVLVQVSNPSYSGNLLPSDLEACKTKFGLLVKLIKDVRERQKIMGSFSK